MLIVDDNRELVDLMGKIMERQGYEVHQRYNGQDGIGAAELLKPDVLLLDIGMPQLDGYAVCAHIRRQSWGKQLPIIALTGYGREADKQRSWAAGFDGHVLKPIDYASLPELLAETIAAKKDELDK
ncbi:response regulator [Spirosoma rhododendri]|uniref:response regulator n=1 Tax=Spirosoma rhododendri TaxID=2728024 RepID=UPI0020C33AB3|nr:response regulator [Spirosoma rhododendri]